MYLICITVAHGNICKVFNVTDRRKEREERKKKGREEIKKERKQQCQRLCQDGIGYEEKQSIKHV